MAHEAFGVRLRRFREAEGFTTAALAQQVGVSEGAIRQMETGNVKSPSFAVGLRIATTLRVDLYDLAFGDVEGSVSERIDRLEAQVVTLMRRRTEPRNR